MASLAEQRREERRAKNQAKAAALAEKFPVVTPEQLAAAREAKQQADADAAKQARIAARKAREARRAWMGGAERPHAHNPLNRPPGWRKERALSRQDARDLLGA